jgi:hypothetical protein
MLSSSRPKVRTLKTGETVDGIPFAPRPPAPDRDNLQNAQLGGMFEIGNCSRNDRLRNSQGAAERLKVRHHRKTAADPRVDVVAVHQIDGDRPATEPADPTLKLPRAMGLRPCIACGRRGSAQEFPSREQQTPVAKAPAPDIGLSEIFAGHLPIRPFARATTSRGCNTRPIVTM